MELSLLAVILGFILDLIVGDPHWLYHPIRLVGHLISGLEKLLRSIFPKTEQGELIAGGFLLVLTAGITTGCCLGTSPGGRSGASLSEICAGSHHVLLGTGDQIPEDRDHESL